MFAFFLTMHENLYKTIRLIFLGAIQITIYLCFAIIPRGKTNTHNWTVAEWMNVMLMPKSTVL